MKWSKSPNDGVAEQAEVDIGEAARIVVEVSDDGDVWIDVHDSRVATIDGHRSVLAGKRRAAAVLRKLGRKLLRAGAKR